PAKWGVQIAGMIFQTRSKPLFHKIYFIVFHIRTSIFRKIYFHYNPQIIAIL
ncbi:DUF6783 domain-containing protein, partial [Anaerobutyricum hallii]|uniref:DUF6783 domain-containing protein n=1 Tax=Anaerobutyricum hallii TaxID=39488 RepID=UPI003AB91BCC